MVIRFRLNGKHVEVDVPDATTLLALLRETLGLSGTKEGCGMGECGACTIVIDGRAVNACLVLASQVEGKEVLTIEGIGNDALHPIQQAFIEEGAIQCGFCTPGFIMSTYALLEKDPSPSDEAIVEHLSGNLCRCTGYAKILRAVRAAAEAMATAREGGRS